MFELISATVCSLHFMFHDFEIIKRNYEILFLAIGLITIVLSLCDFFISAKFNMFVMFLYASMFLMSFLSSIHWVVIANIDEVEHMSKYILWGFSFMFIGFLFFLAKFPECVIQNKIVDYFFQSHIIWHLCCVGGAVSYYMFLYNYNQMIMSKK
jgi:predicted membrane channel-forming protein YqfA (hemolysin III family)